MVAPKLVSMAAGLDFVLAGGLPADSWAIGTAGGSLTDEG